MAKKALPLLTGGLNEKTRPDLIKDDQLQVCTNYEINGDGFLYRRKAASEYDSELTTAIDGVFDSVSFVSEPYYPQTRIKVADIEMDSDFILFIFGTTSSGAYELHAFFKKEGSWTNVVNSDDNTLSDLLTDGDINYDSDSDVQIAVAQDSVFIADGVNNTHMVSIDTDGNMKAGVSGIPAPTNKARVTEMTDWQPELWENTENATYLSTPGLFQCVYTVVTKTGEESNPSPLSDTLDMQFFKLDADSVDERWIEKVGIKDLAVPDVPDNILEQLESFRVYMRVIRYSEGGDAKTLEFTEDFKITVKNNDDGSTLHYGTNTGNEYTVTIFPEAGNVASYENDVAPVAKTVDQLGGITMVGNVKIKKTFPHEFKYNTPITLNNTDSKGYVDAIIKIRLWDKDAAEGIDNFTLSDFMRSNGILKFEGTGGLPDLSNHIRIYDEDLTTPIMVLYNGYNYASDDYNISGSNQYIDIYIKIPYLKPASPHTIYFVWTPVDEHDNYDGVPEHYNIREESVYTWEGNIGAHYGRFVQVRWDNWSRQQVWSNTKVSDGDLIVDDFEGRFSKISNKADTSISTINSDTDIIDNPFFIPIINNKTISGNAVEFSHKHGYVDYDYDDTISLSDKGTVFLRIDMGDLTYMNHLSYISLLTLRYDDDKFLSFYLSGNYFATSSGGGDIGNGDYYNIGLIGQESTYDEETHQIYFGYLKNMDDDSNMPVTQNIEDAFLAISWDKKTSLQGVHRVAINLYYRTTGGYRHATADWRESGFSLTDPYEGSGYQLPGSIFGGARPSTMDNDTLSFGGGFAYGLNEALNSLTTIKEIRIGHMGDLEDKLNPTGRVNSKYDDFRFSTNLFLDPEDDSHNDMFINLANYMPGFDNMIGYEYSTSSPNQRVTFGDTKEIVLKPQENMVKWTDVNYTSFPDLFFKQVKEPVKKVMAAPSFLQFQYQNTFIIFTRNSINRFVLEGSASGWSGSSSSLIEEKTQYGLLADKSLVRAGDALFWLSEVGVVMWNKDGMNLISKNIVDVPIDGNAVGFYSPLNNQYILYVSDSDSYVYHIERNAWTKYTGLDVISASTLTGGSQVDNVNLLLDSDGTINKYPTEDYTSEESEIKTKDLFFEKGVLRKMKADFESDVDTDVDMISIMTKNDLSGNEITKTNTITNPNPNHWRGISLANSRGKEVSFKITNANIIKSIMYDLRVEE